MAVRIVRLGSPRLAGEGLRIGTVRRPPRGVPKAEYARRNYYDVWLPVLAPSAMAVKAALGVSTAAQWRRFESTYRREMSDAAPRGVIDVLAVLSDEAPLEGIQIISLLASKPIAR
jgi:uncharacterized protein YeaO (DUF488 family)